VWADDWSGNTSKKWNKHNGVCFQNLCLPHTFLKMESTVKTLTVSNVCSATELMQALVEQLK
jgi:hypothetical protein